MQAQAGELADGPKAMAAIKVNEICAFNGARDIEQILKDIGR